MDWPTKEELAEWKSHRAETGREVHEGTVYHRYHQLIEACYEMLEEIEYCQNKLEAKCG